MARTVLGANSRTSNASPTGIPQGTPGGRSTAKAVGRRPGMSLSVNDEHYLWLLLAIETTVMWVLRKKLRRYHGG